MTRWPLVLLGALIATSSARSQNRKDVQDRAVAGFEVAVRDGSRQAAFESALDVLARFPGDEVGRSIYVAALAWIGDLTTAADILVNLKSCAQCVLLADARARIVGGTRSVKISLRGNELGPRDAAADLVTKALHELRQKEAVAQPKYDSATMDVISTLEKVGELRPGSAVVRSSESDGRVSLEAHGIRLGSAVLLKVDLSSAGFANLELRLGGDAASARIQETAIDLDVVALATISWDQLKGTLRMPNSVPSPAPVSTGDKSASEILLAPGDHDGHWLVEGVEIPVKLRVSPSQRLQYEPPGIASLSTITADAIECRSSVSGVRVIELPSRCVIFSSQEAAGTLTVISDGREPATMPFMLAPGRVEKLELSSDQLALTSESVAANRVVVGWSLVGTGIATVAGAAVLGWLAFSANEDVKDAEADYADATTYPALDVAWLEAYEAADLRTGFLTGAALSTALSLSLIVSGSILLATAPSKEESTETASGAWSLSLVPTGDGILFGLRYFE